MSKYSLCIEIEEKATLASVRETDLSLHLSHINTIRLSAYRKLLSGQILQKATRLFLSVFQL